MSKKNMKRLSILGTYHYGSEQKLGFQFFIQIAVAFFARKMSILNMDGGYQSIIPKI